MDYIVREHRREKSQLCSGQDRPQELMQGLAQGFLNVSESLGFALRCMDNFKGHSTVFMQCLLKRPVLFRTEVKWSVVPLSLGFSTYIAS